MVAEKEKTLNHHRLRVLMTLLSVNFSLREQSGLVTGPDTSAKGRYDNKNNQDAWTVLKNNIHAIPLKNVWLVSV
jgi:hypothetical protein